MNDRPFSVTYGDEIPSQPEFWRDETTYRMTGGFYLDSTDLESGMIVDKGCPLAINYATQKAKPCKNIRITSAAANNAVNIQVSKGHLMKVGDLLSDGTNVGEIKTIDRSVATFDKITLKATLGESLAVGQVLHECTASDDPTPKNKANHLNYRRMRVAPDLTERRSITAVGQAYEIFGSRLPNPCSDVDKENLGHRFLFID